MGCFSTAKYDEQFKFKLVQRYLSGTGFKTVANEHGVRHSMVDRWVAQYRVHGMSGLTRKGTSYDAAFKLQVLKRMWDECWSQARTAAIFDIRSPAHIGKWARQYDAEGVDALMRRRRPRPMTTEPPKPVDPRIEDTQTLAQLRRENEYLRAENAYLKKLDALIQQKQADARKKRKS